MGITNFRDKYTELFGIIMTINFPIFFAFNLHTGQLHKYELILRTICTLCAIPFIFYKHWHITFKKYFSYIWFLAITACLPAFFVFMLLAHNFSIFSIMSLFAALSFLILIASFRELVLSIVLGTIIAFFIHHYLIGYFYINISVANITSILSNLVATLIIGYLFTLKRDKVNSAITVEFGKINTYSIDLETYLETQNRKLKMALKAKDNFLNNMSHELRTPLHGILAFSTFLKEKLPRLSKTKKEYYLSQIIENTSRMNSLVSNLTDLSATKRSNIKLHKERDNITELIHSVTENIQSLYNTEISIADLSSEPLWCYFDKFKITQVLEHLLLNAIKFSNKKLITIKIEKHKYYLEILVIDQGLGIKPEETNINFEEGSLTKTKAGGKGIGLAICKNIMTAHSGYLSVKNNIKAGCTFTISLPTKD